jgi:hypothetical protein
MVDALSGIKYKETIKRTHARARARAQNQLSGESQILRNFKIGSISQYYLSLQPSSANFQKRHLLQRIFAGFSA